MSLIEGNNRSSQAQIAAPKKGKEKQTNIEKEIEQGKGSIILTTQLEIDQIKKDNKELREEIETESLKNNLNGPSLVTKLGEIQELSILYAQKIEVESQKKRDLETLKNASLETINDNQKMMNKSNGIALPQLQAKIKQLEYKLEKTRSRHNESLAQINMLKEQVNMTRRERVIFSNVFKKLESDIKLKDEEFKKYMIEKMQVDIKKKGLEEELLKIKAHAKKEVLLFKNEYQQLFSQSRSLQKQNDSIDYNASNHPLIFQTEVILQETHNNTNLNNTINNNSIISNNMNNSSINPNQIMNNNSTLTNQSAVRGQSQKQHQTINLQDIKEEVEKYQFMFQKLQKEVGIDDLEHLIDLFENIEKENDELYESANKKSDEIDMFKKQIKDVENEINKYSKHKDNKQKTNTTKDKKIQNLQKYDKKIEGLEGMTKSVNTDISSVNAKLMKIAEKFNIKKPEGELDEASFITFLKDVEARINDIINMSLYCEGKVINIDHHHGQHHQHETLGTLTSLSKKGDSDNGIGIILDGVKKKSDKEAERILIQDDFGKFSKDEIKQFKENKGRIHISQKGKKHKV